MTTTDSSGDYEFTGVMPGDYFVVETVPAGWTSNGLTQHAVTVESGEVYGDEGDEPTDFLNISSVEIRGTKYEDFNADGIVNGLDAGLAGWDVKVWFDDGDGVFEGAGEDTLVTTETTDGNGDWSATLTALGTYFVEEDLSNQPGWSQTGPGTSPNEGFYEVEVTYNPATTSLEVAATVDSDGDGVADDGSVNTNDLDFLNTELGSIEGTKFYDQNDNDTIDGDDIPLAGWEVKLYSADADDGSGGGIAGNGTLEAGEIAAATPVQTTTTDSSGDYEFTDVMPGDYFVVETVPSGWTSNGPIQHAVTVESGEVYGDEGDEPTDFLNISSIDISGTKYEDFNADGIVNGPDEGLPGWDIKVWLDDGDGVFEGAGEDTLVTTETTDGNGDWSATLTALGTYFVEEDLSNQPGWSQSGPGESPNEGFYEVEVTYNPATTSLEVAATVDSDGDGAADDGSVNTDDLDFLNWEPGSISGIKYHDLNADGDQDSGEGGLAGWTIYVDENGNDQLDAGEAFDVTDATGAWTIEGLTPSDTPYTVREVLQPDWFNSDPGGAAAAQELSVTVSSGEDNGGHKFGNYQLGSISGIKYHDLNADGDQDTGENGLAGWKIYVDENGNDQFDEGEAFDITDATGAWTIEGLTPSDTPYTVREVLQDDWFNSDPGGAAAAQEISVTVSSGENDSGHKFGNFQLFDISGYKWGDLDGDGVWDAGEVGLGGWTITLDINNDGTVDASTVTDENGFYQFTDLMPGTSYAITEVNQLGWLNTFDGSTVVVGVSGMDASGTEGVAEPLNFGNQMLEGAVRTPGFWKGKLGQTFWDGDPDNDGVLKDGQQQKEGEDFPEFPDNDLVYENMVDLDGDGEADDFGLLVGDWNGNGITDPGENTRLYTLEEALAALVVEDKNGPGNGKGGGRDAYTILERDLIASWLNHLNDSPDGSTGGGPSSSDLQASYWMDQAVQWLNGVDNPGAPNRPVKTSSKYWKNDDEVGLGIEAGRDSHNALDSWNNDGVVTANGEEAVTSFDGDNWSTEVAQAWNEAYGSVSLTQDAPQDELNVLDSGDGGDLA